MSYSKISLFLLLSSSVAMAMEIPGTGQASALGQTTQPKKDAGTRNTLEELKKLFPAESIHLLTPQEENRAYSQKLSAFPLNYNLKASGMSKRQIALLTGAKGGYSLICFWLEKPTKEDLAAFSKCTINNLDDNSPIIMLSGVRVPDSQFIIIISRELSWTPKKTLCNERYVENVNFGTSYLWPYHRVACDHEQLLTI